MVGLPVYFQDIVPWICGSVISTEEEVNPIYASFHHVAYNLTIHLNFMTNNCRPECGTSKLFADFWYLWNKLDCMISVKELMKVTS